MSKKIILVVCFLALAGGLLAVPVSAVVFEGQGPYLGLEYGEATGLGDQDVRFTTAMIIRAALGLLGIVALVIIIYAGFKWMTAGGNEENVKSAQKILMAAVIGLVIIFSAYAIATFVLKNLYEATTGQSYFNQFD